ncbi:hypothetical protein ACRALDRAFT_2021870 [Sodiomyces alcalophilus JCM 7366]|uniref:uncharacterized protein n=1 Tax=Sodiomyces alcalophilus JCM 7366 TaxID=591952 RepID=UPI0039B5B434
MRCTPYCRNYETQGADKYGNPLKPYNVLRTVANCFGGDGCGLNEFIMLERDTLRNTIIKPNVDYYRLALMIDAPWYLASYHERSNSQFPISRAQYNNIEAIEFTGIIVWGESNSSAIGRYMKERKTKKAIVYPQNTQSIPSTPKLMQLTGLTHARGAVPRHRVVTVHPVPPSFSPFLGQGDVGDRHLARSTFTGRAASLAPDTGPDWWRNNGSGIILSLLFVHFIPFF